MKIVIGIGNPGEEYAHTRHNVGFDVVDLLAARHGVQCGRHKFHALIGECQMAGEPVLLAKPVTFVNESGLAVREILDWHKAAASQVMVVCDDVNLPLGKLRIRPKGSSGGHKGLKSIEAHLGAPDFARLRIGIGASPSPELINHVLSRFAKPEQPVMDEAKGLAADAVELWIQSGLDACMNRFNVSADSPSADKKEKPPVTAEREGADKSVG
jgi:PTH1 family peptidyl-tRNA hydrolase